MASAVPVCRSMIAAGLAAMLVASAAHATESPAQRLTVGGTDRSYRLHRPAGLGRQTPVPLVIMLHGGFGSARQAEQSYHWDALADREGFVVAYPDGLHHSWNAGGMCCGPALRDGIDDTGFIARLIEVVSAAENIDPRRVFITGMSNGAAMAYRYACEGRVPVAAIGPVAGTFSEACPAVRPMSLLAIHGLDDGHVPYAGGPGTKGVTKGDWRPVPESVARFRDADQCAAPVLTRNGPVETAGADCAQGRAMILLTIAGAGHQWPGSTRKGVLQHLLGGDPPSTVLDATERLWAFFRDHPAPP